MSNPDRPDDNDAQAADTGGQSAEAGGSSAAHEAGHASIATYVVIGIVLTVITAVEVAVFYIPQLDRVLVPTLLTLSAAKFVIVVLFYMHLRFDSPIFRRVFFGPMFLAVTVVVALVILFKVLPGFDLL
jgi:cytochrome c oxidase subunit 4